MRSALLAVAAVLAAAAPAYAIGQQPTLAHLRTCHSERQGRGCVHEPGLVAVKSVTLDPSGRWLYTTGSEPNVANGSVAAFARDPDTGALTARGCVADDGSGEGCVDGNALLGADVLALSGDGRHAYVAGIGRLAVFERDPDSGGLRQVACLKATKQLGACVPEPLLPKEPTWIGVSPDGGSVYEVSAGQVLVFARDSATGSLTRSSCLRADGKRGCGALTRLIGAGAATFAPDGRQLYVSAGALILTLARDPSTGALSLSGCAATSPYVRDSCAAGQGTSGSFTIAASPDGSTVWGLSSAGGGAVVAFARTPDDGTLHKRACVSETGRHPCSGVHLLLGLRNAALAPDGRRLVAVSGHEFEPTLLTFDVSGGGDPVLLACVTGSRNVECSHDEALAEVGYQVELAIEPSGRDVYAAFHAEFGGATVTGFSLATGIATRTLIPKAGHVPIRITCPDGVRGGVCVGRLSVDRPDLDADPPIPGRPIGRTRYRVPAGEARTVRLRVSAKRVTRALGGRGARYVEIVATDASGHTAASVQPVKLRRRP